MLKWWIGFSSAVFLALCAWVWAFVLMGYQAKADIEDLKGLTATASRERGELRTQVMVVKEISARTEKNTEQIRDYLLKKAER